jgi:hypothetical protein
MVVRVCPILLLLFCLLLANKHTNVTKLASSTKVEQDTATKVK